MKFEEIREAIQNTSNTYEDTHNIKTTKVVCVYNRDNCAIFLGHKTDESITIFYARKGKRADENSWQWFCPSDVEILYGLPTLCQIYTQFNRTNKVTRREVI